jgi:hypothetical protein
MKKLNTVLDLVRKTAPQVLEKLEIHDKKLESVKEQCKVNTDKLEDMNVADDKFKNIPKQKAAKTVLKKREAHKSKTAPKISLAPKAKHKVQEHPVPVKKEKGVKGKPMATHLGLQPLCLIWFIVFCVGWYLYN